MNDIIFLRSSEQSSKATEKPPKRRFATKEKIAKVTIALPSSSSLSSSTLASLPRKVASQAASSTDATKATKVYMFEFMRQYCALLQ